MTGTFPFGAPLEPCAANIDASSTVLVIGAYPSALHVRWTPPVNTELQPVRAFAVDNEPFPFWDGSDEEERIEAWAAEHFRDEYGSVSPVGRLNGSSGVWLRDDVLGPLGIAWDAVSTTDCLDTYRASEGQASRIADTYQPFADHRELPRADLPAHPSETQIVNEAIGEHADRLRAEVATASPELVITLGNAAARAAHQIFRAPDGPIILQEHDYGTRRTLAVDGREVEWLPLAHPGAPPKWQDIHGTWIDASH